MAFKERKNIQQVVVKVEPADYKIFIPQLPEELDFCGEKVPLNDLDVKERIERELFVNAYWHSSTILAMKRANRWFPVIEPILKKYGIPDDFKYLAVIESNLSNVVSNAGATGFWQLMEASAKKYGLEVTKEIDERYNIEKSTEAACKYLREVYSKYKSWTLAAASYNYGMNGIDLQINRQKTKNYYNLFLNTETYRFVARIIAMKEIMRNPEKYGYYLKKEDLYQPIETEKIIVKSSINNLANFAEKHGINYKVLKLLNPWLRDNYLPNKSNKIYLIKIPKNNEYFAFDE
ncbi:lytic transglycosylase domain-containing protein [Rosettibacter firmus]|uniref:lytic transglycosylase domain-containing protein n=1 Tax=Rosettibacter firmus TaxID=3111522 RepID=UPI00336BD1F4